MTMLVEKFTAGLALPWPIMVVRLVGATLLCASIGFERQTTQHAAGLRTHMLVGLTSAVFSLITLHMLHSFDSETGPVQMDPIRLVEAVTVGVAFLAAGMIIFNRGKVRGLTTGAAKWVAAGIGLSAGLGLWAMVALAASLALVISVVLKRLERPFGDG
ncbi:MgtC/SapB family protein [soil metagenome]